MIEGADALVVPGRVVLIGEIHGSQQAPAAIDELARAARGPVRVGLELPLEEQPAIDAFFANGDVTQLTRGDFWRSQYGVATRAMVDLLSGLRQLTNVRVFAFVGVERSDRTHDEVMADNVLTAWDREPEATFIVLAGNLHTRTQRSEGPWHDLVPMGEVVAAQAPTVALDISWRSGETWCAIIVDPDEPPIAGVHPLMPRDDHGDAPCVRWFERPDADGYDGELYLVDLEASLPLSGAARTAS